MYTRPPPPQRNVKTVSIFYASVSMCTRPPSASTFKSFTARAGFFFLDRRGRKRMSKIPTRMLNLTESIEKIVIFVC